MSAGLRRLWAVRTAVGATALAALGGCTAWSSFVIARGVPGECGGDAPACPPGSASAFVVLMIAAVVLFPAGVALVGRRRPELWAAGVALGFGGIAVGVLASRFVADPITTSTTVTWWFAGVTGTIAVLALLAALALAVPDDA